ncbi:MAG: hypothetical protein A3E83_08700 [Gammaproteobacteria bacterium RIFCSPHIGHO2_12_FULL_41_20]|nr:MAG: hypothetical protein A3E83_08700 [Gammaproteobacteria bacterium RIFCSPHIGHO2_12_FULL_41_20]
MLGRLNDWFATAKSVDTRNQSYDRSNSAHQDLINAQINLFKQAWKELRNSDISYAGMGLGAYAIRAYLLPYLILVPTFLIDVGFIIAVVGYLNHIHNQPQMQEFKKQLAKLLDLYHWCEKSNDINITTDDAFLKLLRTIAPHVLEYKDIQLTKPIDPTLISMQFAEIMAQAPHRIPPELLIDAVRAQRITKENNSSWFSLFHTSRTQTKRILYNNAEAQEGWKEWAAHQVTSIKHTLLKR